MHVTQSQRGRCRHSKRFLQRQVVLAAVVGVPLLAAGAGTVSAAPNKFNFYTGTGTQNWTSPAGWSDGAPTAEDVARVLGSGTFDITSPAVVNRLTFGSGTDVSPTLNLNAGGSLLSTHEVIFGNSANGLATLNQNGGSLLIPGNEILWMGLNGSATWNMSGGTTTVGYPGFSSLGNLGIAIGTGAGSSTLNMSGGVINSDAVFQVARSLATGTMNLTGGTINVGTEVWIGQAFGEAGGVANITHSGGTINTGYNQPGANVYGNFIMGVGNNGRAATYTLSGTGAVNVQRHMYVGGGSSVLTGFSGGEGNFVMDGGTVTIGDPRQVSGSSLYIGWAGGTGVAQGNFVVNSGTLNVTLPGGEIIVGSYIGTPAAPAGQSGTLTITGGQVLNPKGLLQIGRAGATGTVNLSGGLLSVNSLRWVNPAGNTNLRQFNFTGGTLEANTADTASALTNSGGTFRPRGSNTGVFTTIGTNGSYVQNSGTLALDMSSAAAYDSLNLTGGGVGAATLAGGTVNVTGIDGYTPSFGVSVPVITAKAITDSATWNLPAPGAGNTWDQRITTVGANQVKSLTVVRSSASTLSSGSSWTSASWTAGIPNATDASAKLAGAGGSIDVDSPVTLGYLQLDGTGDWTVGGGSTLTVATAGGATGGIVAFGGAHAINAPVAFNSNASIGTHLSSTSVTLGGNVSGSSTVEKTGPGSLTLGSGASTFTGNWKISGGALNIASDANLGAAAATLGLSNATLNVAGAFDTGRAIVLNGANTLSAGGDSTLSGVISGPGGITKAGSNALVLGAANSYAGPTNIPAGSLRQAVANAVPANSAVTLAADTTFDLNGFSASVGSIAGAGNISTGGANLTVGNDNTSTVYSGIIAGGGTFTKNGTGTLEFNRPAGTAPVTPIDGNIIVNGGTLQFNALNETTYDLPANDVTVNAGANLALGSTVPNGGAFYNDIHGAGSLTVTTSFLVLLTGNNDYSGGTTITNGATASISTLNSLGAAGTPIHFKGHGTRELGYAGGLWFEIGDHVTPAAGTFSHPITVDGWKIAILNAAGNNITLDQPISGDGIIEYSNGGYGGTFRLDAKNTYRGISQINSGTNIVLGVDNALPVSGTALLGLATLDLNGYDQTLGYLVSAGTPEIKLTDGTLAIKNDVADPFSGAWGGKMTGNGSFMKTGGSTQIFSLAAGEASTYTGGTTVEQGTLQIIGNINALPAGGPVTIGKDGNLQFTTTAAASGLEADAPVTFSGNISGAGEVQVTTLETLVLSGSNTYTGGTRLSNGTLLVSADSNLGAANGRITFFSNGSNPGPILKYGAAFNSTRNVLVETANAFVDTGEHNVALGNVSTNPLLPEGSFFKQSGSGTLTVNHVRVNGLSVLEGALKIAPSGGATSGTSRAANVTIGGLAKLDLTDNKLIVTAAGAIGSWTGSAYTGVSGLIAAGRNGGAWNGNGIITSMPDATTNYTTLGAAKAAEVLGIAADATAVWSGQTVTGSDTLVKYTYGGDANLDGSINIDDYGRIDANVASSGSVFGWYNGDFNYDGAINIDDYGIIDGNIGKQGAPFNTPAGGGADAVALSGVVAVPEPASFAVLGLGAAGLLGRRHRRLI